MPKQRGRPPKYDWDRYFDDDIHILYQGRDFQTSPQSFRALVHRTANSRGMKAETTINLKAFPASVRFRFYEE